MTQRTARREVSGDVPSTSLSVPLRHPAQAYAAAPAEHALVPIAVPEVVLGRGEVLVAVELATLCEVDLASLSAGLTSPPPRLIGHEQVGRVVAYGPGERPVTSDGLPLTLGDRIVWARRVRCGRCAECEAAAASALSAHCLAPDVYGHSPARRGWELSGGVASHVHLRAHTAIVRARDWVPPTVLALASCATAAAAAAVEAVGGVGPGSRVFVAGCDAAGLTAIAMLRERGATVVAVDSRGPRRAWAEEFGARLAQHPDEAAAGADALIEFTETASVPPRWGADPATASRLVRVASHAPPCAAETHTPTRTGGEARHLRAGVAFLERADHALFARLVERVIPLGAVTDATSVTPLSGLRVGVRPG